MKRIIIIGLILLLAFNGCGDQEMKDKVVFETNKGIVKIKLFNDKAPITTQNFRTLVTSGFYNGLTFHRYVEGFVFQGGDPKGDGTG